MPSADTRILLFAHLGIADGAGYSRLALLAARFIISASEKSRD